MMISANTTWIELIPAGTFSTNDGRGPFYNSDPQAVVRLSRHLLAGGLPIDFDHATDRAAPQGLPAPAAGWIREFRIVAGAIQGRVEWTPRGASALKQKEYRFISPVFEFDPPAGNATIGGTLGVTGAATFGSTLGLTGAFTWNASAPDLTELNAPRIEVRDVDYPSLFNDTNELFGSMKSAVAVTVRQARVFNEMAAGSCSGKPTYTLCSGATLGTCTTYIANNCGAPSGTVIGETDCTTTVTSVPAGQFIFWVNASNAVSCAAKFAPEYEYTIN